MHKTLIGRICGALALSLVALMALHAGADGSKKQPRIENEGLANEALAIQELSRFQVFVPSLPSDLLPHFEFSLPMNDVIVGVAVDKITMRSDRFKVLVDLGDGTLNEVAPPAIRTYKGALANRPGTTVMGSLLPTGFSGTIHLEDGSTWIVQPLSDFRPEAPKLGQHVSYSSADAIPDGRGCALGRPGFPFSKYRSPLSQAIAAGQQGTEGSNEGGIAGTTPSQIEIGCECDFEFFQKNASSVANTINDVELIVSNVNVIYDRDANITFELGTIVVRSDVADPYAATTIDGRLTEFENKWGSAPESGIYRDISHMFSGYTFSGGTIGIAYLGGVCSGVGGVQYGVVESRYTTTLAYRISLSAHELGHNWNASHCDSQGAAACHIMCSSNGGCGGIAGANLKLDPYSISQITGFLGAIACDFVRPLPVAVPFTDLFSTTTLATARWTYNDGGVANTAASNEPSAPNALNLDSTGANSYDDDQVRTNFILLGGTASATASYKVERIGVESAEILYVEYLNSSLDWVVLNTLTSDGTNQTGFTAYEHSLPTNARHNQFRLRFRTDGNDTGDDWYVDDVNVFVVAVPPPPANDECVEAISVSTGTTAFDSTYATESAFAIPNSCTNSSDGTITRDVWFSYHAPCSGRTTISTCGLAAFDTRVVVYVSSSNCPTAGELVAACNDDFSGCASGTSTASFNSIVGNNYFVRVGGATSGGPGSLAITCVVTCPADVSGDLYVDAADLSMILANWGGSGSGDIDGNGSVDGIDLSVVLAGWGACP